MVFHSNVIFGILSLFILWTCSNCANCFVWISSITDLITFFFSLIIEFVISSLLNILTDHCLKSFFTTNDFHVPDFLNCQIWNHISQYFLQLYYKFDNLSFLLYIGPLKFRLLQILHFFPLFCFYFVIFNLYSKACHFFTILNSFYIYLIDYIRRYLRFIINLLNISIMELVKFWAYAANQICGMLVVSLKVWFPSPVGLFLIIFCLFFPQLWELKKNKLLSLYCSPNIVRIS